MTQPHPENIGRFRVLDLLGQGGMGLVYLAEDPRLKRKVAVKVIRKEARDNEFDDTLERFNREAEISARLNHPNIITVFDVGEDPQAGVFLAMEYIQGQSLAAYLRDHRPSPEAGLMLLIQAMRAMEAAAREGIVHRDIKPENMLVSRSGRLKLMDFGLARGDDTRITATGMLLGTPSFSAPELIEGREPSLESDRYAFCVTAFEVAFGALPFGGRTLGVTLYNIMHNPPTFPEGTAPELRAVFERALAKAPADRYPDFAGFMTALVRAYPLDPAVQGRILAKLEPQDEMEEGFHPGAPRIEHPTTRMAATPLPSQSAPGPEASPEPEPEAPPPEATQRGPSPSLVPKAAPPKSGAPPRSLLPKVALPSPPKPQGPARSPHPVPAPKVAMDKLLQGLRPAQASPRPTPRATPSPAPGPAPTFESRATPAPMERESEEGIDPFAGIDWEEVLSGTDGDRESGRISSQELLKDLEAGIQDADVLWVETQLEDAEAREDFRALESGLRKLDPADLLAAEERAEAEERSGSQSRGKPK